jgi:hypothetical protein
MISGKMYYQRAENEYLFSLILAIEQLTEPADEKTPGEANLQGFH